MLLDLLYTAGGFALLLWGADRFVAGAARIADLLGVHSVVIGVTIVGFGTSAPEIMVSTSAAAKGLTGMAVGNALGSNIANVGLVIGATALLRPLTAELTGTLRSEIPLLVGLTAAAALLFMDNTLDRLDAVLLLAAFVGMMIWIVHRSLRMRAGHLEATGPEADLPTDMSMNAAAAWLAVGLLVLLGGANLLVAGAENLARQFGVSEMVIGLTVIAVGTSLPELAVSVVSALRGSGGIAVGNIIGSNLFNLLAVIGVAGLVHPAPLEPTVLTLRFPVFRTDCTSCAAVPA